MGDLTSMQQFDLSHNSILGRVPVGVASLVEVVSLKLNNNQLQVDNSHLLYLASLA